ncbi:MAG: hypothetical protein LBJ00_14945 [Planctomycetaceae bacterium]|nr:hypothetical protein [Planctomycetaceae bacterium]
MHPKTLPQSISSVHLAPAAVLDTTSIKTIPKPVWAVGFAPEQPLHVVTLTCSAP